MARIYRYYGQFEVHTDCPDLEKIAKAMNETARTFADTLKFNSQAERGPEYRGFMYISNDFEMEIPVNETVDDNEEEAEVESA